MSLYFLTERPESGYIWYYTNDSRYAYTVFRLAEPGRSRGNDAYITGDFLCDTSMTEGLLR